MKVNVAGSLKTVSAIKVNVGGTLRSVSRLKSNIAGALKDAGSFYTPLTALTASPTSVSKFSLNPTVDTANVTVTPTGGQAPFTYSWVRISGSGAALSATSAITKFREVFEAPDTVSGVFRCTVTDFFGSTATADVTAEFTYQDLS